MMSHPFHPIANRYPLMAQEQLNDFAQHLKEYGYQPQIRKIITLDGLILDGRNFYLACRIAGLNPLEWQEEYTGDTSEEALIAFVEAANEHRRHLTIDDLKRRREERIERVAKRRREGASLRTIAEEEKVSAPQVLADLQVGTVKGLTVEPKTGKVDSKDGKQRPARKPKAPEQDFPPDEVQQHPEEFSFDAPGEQANAEDPYGGTPFSEEDAPPDVQPASDGMTDGIGLTVPEELLDAFDPDSESTRQRALTLCRQLRDAIHEYASSPAGAQLRRRLSREGRSEETVRYRSKELQALAKLIEHWAPYCCACPYCVSKGAFPEPNPECGVCYGTGWVCLDAYQSAPVDFRDKVEALRRDEE